ncbi:MAG TPA: HD domain-containing protein [Thermomicrobiales bacterium]|nr:HD domain-containing protein [Thermomicrobiales bacterium]
MTALLAQLSAAQRRAAARLGAAFARRGHALYLVGGPVRDLLLGQTPADLDFATDAAPAAIRAAAEAAGADAVYTANERFATVGARVEGEALEITTFRGAAGGDPLGGLRADLALRDFTINAMALPLAADAAPIDPFDGRGDLARRTIRATGDPAARFAEDPLRALRAARFAAQFGFAIEPDTRVAVAAFAPRVAAVSAERVGAEWTRLLAAPHVADGLRLAERLGLLAATLPEVAPLAEFSAAGSKDLWLHTLQVVARTPARPAARWAALLHDVAKPRTFDATGGEVHFFGHEALGARIARKTLRRLKFDRETIEAVARLVELHGRPAQYDETWTDGAVRRLMLEVGPHLDDLLDLARADVTSARADVQRRARARIGALAARCARLQEEEELARLQSPLDGNALMALFARPPGPWIRPLKDYLRDLVIDGDLAPGDTARARDLALAWMAAHGDQAAPPGRRDGNS